MSKRTSSLVILAALVLAVMTALAAVADDKTAANAAKATPAKAADTRAAAEPGATSYLIVSPHTKAECVAALDAVAAKGDAALGQYDWGCMSGDHTGYLKVQASSEQEALAQVPETIRSKAKAIKLNKFTVDQVKSFHSEATSH